MIICFRYLNGGILKNMVYLLLSMYRSIIYRHYLVWISSYLTLRMYPVRLKTHPVSDLHLCTVFSPLLDSDYLPAYGCNSCDNQSV